MDEALVILAEECAEVIVAVSKCHRFGLLGCNPYTEQSNVEHLEQELGDLLALVDILAKNGTVDMAKINRAVEAKKNKLRQWSSINLEQGTK